MRMRTGIFAVTTVGLFIGMLQACATEAAVVEDDDSGPPAPVADAARDTSTPKFDSAIPPVDAAKPDSATPDSSTPDTSTADAADAAIGPRPGELFDPSKPKPGDACPAGVNVNDVVARGCGKCGKQNALCEAGRIVGAYGACTNENTTLDACLPNEISVSACGFCGQSYKRCGGWPTDPSLNGTCSAMPGLCVNQVANGCTANEVTYIEGVCASPTDVRRQVCSATCTKGAPDACAPRPLDVIAVSQTAGTTITGAFQTTNALKLPLLTGSTCPATESGTTSSLYHYVRLTNAGAQEVTVSVTNGIPVGTTARPSVTLAAYPAAAVAAIPTDRKLCAGALGQATPEKLTLTIPANSSVIVHTMLDSATATQSALALEVRTIFVGPETPPAPQYTVDMSQATGAAVNQAIAFDAASTLRSLAIASGSPVACPLILSASETSFSYIRVNNTGATDRVVTLATTGGTDVSLAYYTGPAPISTTRLACTGLWSERLTDETVTGAVVPAMGYITVYVGRYSGTGGTSNLRVTTD